MRLLIIDPFVAIRAPSMRSLVRALPAFEDLFSEIEIWATECDIPVGGKVTWRKIPKRVPFSLLHMVDFQFRVTRMLAREAPSDDTVVLTTGCNVPRADIHYMHYWNMAMLEEQRRRPETFKLLPHHRIVAGIVARTEKAVTEDTDTTRWWWSVSRSISEKISSDGASGSFRVLPNPYDPRVFNTEVRAKWKDEMREHYGLRSDEFVFVFSSFGHFERKGLLQAVEAISILLGNGHPVRLLVLGGTPETVSRFHKKLSDTGIDAGFCKFAGLVKNIERHLSAADALIFPSNFEAFSLAEIEAAALGLRLYLTPHYGSEMILREPANGRLLPWDAAGMAKVIEADILDGAIRRPHSEIGEALTADDFLKNIRALFSEVIDSKTKRSHVDLK